VVPLLALGCAQKRVKVTYRSDPPGGGLYKEDGELWGQCPKILWYDLDDEARSRGYLEARGLTVRWPSGPEKRSDDLIRITVDGTDQQVVFLQPRGTPEALYTADQTTVPQDAATETSFRPDSGIREEKAATEASLSPDPGVREEKDDETVWIRRQTSIVETDDSVKNEPNEEPVQVQVKAALKTVDFGDGIMVEFALIPAGEVVMGSAADDKVADSSKGPGYTIRINQPFYMSVYEVTQEQYEKVTNANPSRYPGRRHPVDTVSWNDAQGFCRILADRGKGRCRLPTEAEWEYACRAGTTTAYYWGDSFDGRYAWVITNSEGATHNVGTRLPNAWGLHDMSGNVWEWCQNSYSQDDPNSAEQTEDSVPSKVRYRTLRGGSWGHSARKCQSAHSNWHTPNHRYDDCGFRIVLEAE
jgi:formylglycine-generating enzyme required for sulfatase activity